MCRVLLKGQERYSYAVHLAGGSESATASVMSFGVLDLYSDHMLLVSMEDHQTVLSFQSDAQIYPASLTKIMTAILAIEALDDFDETVAISPALLKSLEEKNASVAGFLPGEQVCVRDLLYGTLLSSGADAAVTLACRVGGSEEAFVKLMNEKARSLGMTHTHFANATGLHEDSHVTTLNDLSLLLEYALDNGVFYRIFTAHQYQTQPTSMHPEGMTLVSTLFDKMGQVGETRVSDQGYMDHQGWILGGKTGYTPEAGLCLATIADIRGKTYLLITAGACGDTSTAPFHVMDAVEVYSHIQK